MSQAGGTLSEGDESEEEIDKLQGIIRCATALTSLTTRRSHSFRLRTLHEEDVFSVGKVNLPLTSIGISSPY